MDFEVEPDRSSTSGNLQVMTTQPKPLRALLIGPPAAGLDTAKGVSLIRARLEELVPRPTIQVPEQDKCTRGELLHTIREWVDQAEADQPHLFYFHGHGGRVHFPELPAPSNQVFYFLQCLGTDGDTEGLLDFEVSAELTRLYTRCGGNVGVFIDACHSGLEVARLTALRHLRRALHLPGDAVAAMLDESIAMRAFFGRRDWAHEAIAQGTPSVLAAESHPGIVRLAGASPVRTALATPTSAASNLALGHFTRHLNAVLKGLNGDWRRTSWGTLAHAVRQRLIDKAGDEEQWIVFAGPSDQLLLSVDKTREPTRSIGCVQVGGNHWIRAGSLTGVDIGDCWALADRAVTTNGEQSAVAHGVVNHVDTNRAHLVLGSQLGESQPVAAFLKRVRNPMPVTVDDPQLAQELKLDETTWLMHSEDPSKYQIRANCRELELVDDAGTFETIRFANDSDGRNRLLELLEDRARANRLVESLKKLPNKLGEARIVFEVGVGEDVLQSGAHLKAGSLLWIHLKNDSDPEMEDTWFIAIVLIDAIGRPRLLSTSQPDGVELGPTDEEYIGRRFGGIATGLKIDWPEQVTNCSSTLPLELLFIMSRRPIQLEHLTHAASDRDAFEMQGLKNSESCRSPRFGPFTSFEPCTQIERSSPPTKRPGEKLEVSTGWGWGSFSLILER